MTAFYGKSSTVLSPQSYYEETVYFLPLRSHSVNPLLWGGLNLLPNFLKREGGGVTGSQIVKGGYRERGMNFSRGSQFLPKK